MNSLRNFLRNFPQSAYHGIARDCFWVVETMCYSILAVFFLWAVRRVFVGGW